MNFHHPAQGRRHRAGRCAYHPKNDLLTLLQDLHDRDLLRYKETRDRKTNRVSVFKLQLTPAGRDLCEGTKTDPAINF